MATQKFSPIKSRHARITRLTTCGAADTGARGKLVTGGFVKVESKAKVENGTEYKMKNAWGDWCVNETDDSLLDRLEPAIDFCEVDPDVSELLTAARVIAATEDEDYATLGTSIGYGMATRATAHFALELWTKMAGGACSGDGDPLWIYSVWPWLHDGMIADLTFENGPQTFSVNNLKSLGASGWGTGPHGDLTVPVDDGEPFMQYVTNVQPPAVTAGAVALA